MEAHGMQRRLAAIMSADVVGYSGLMAADEEGTLARLKGHREELIEPIIAEHQGRIVKLMGDGALVEFASVVEAVRAGIEIQRAMAERNEGAPAAQQIVFRIGINQGDVIVDGDDIYGDGVNVAARLQERATPGGICISDRVHGDIRGKIDVGLDDLGDQELKNIPEPVRVYRVLTGPDAGSGALRRASSRMLLRGVALAAALVVAITGAALWQWPWAPEPTFRLSAKPSIAVLPFANLSKDPEQEYFSDGITIDIITDLSKFHDLFVIARNSVFTYKGRAVKVEEVGRNLGVRYVVEGSVQKLGERVRINAQLIDATTGQHLWADRYDEAAVDLFDLQDRITKHIVRTLAVKLTDIEQERAFSKPTRDLKAYDYVLRGWKLASTLRRKENFEARRLFRKAIERDPNYASAYAGLGNTFENAVLYGWTGSPQATMQRAYDLAQKAIAVDDSSAEGHRLAGAIYLVRRQYDLALVEIERAIAYNPNDAVNYARQGGVLLYSGRPDGAIFSLETALRFDPLMDPAQLTHLGLAYYLKGRYEDAAKILERVSGLDPDYLYAHTILAAVYGQMDLQANAARAAHAVRRLNPFFSTDEFRSRSLFRDPADAARVDEGLRKAGLD